MSLLIDRMREAGASVHVAFHKYTAIRSKSNIGVICIFEGPDDHPYYSTVFRRLDDGIRYAPIIAQGKDNVLALRSLIERSQGEAPANVVYFVDRDFDGLKGCVASRNLYCTSSYSIENYMCEPSVLRPILLDEFKCLSTGEEDVVDNIISMFHERMSEFNEVMRSVNKIIYYARKNEVGLRAIENKLSKYAIVKASAVVCSGADQYKLVGWPEEVDSEPVRNHVSGFDELTPQRDWRGKFLMGFYIDFLNDLKEDRCSQDPIHFRVKRKVSFNPRADMIRTLAVLSPIPACLRDFASRMIV